MKKESASKAREEAEKEAKELRRKEQEDQDRENQEKYVAQDNPEDPPSTSGDIITG